MEIIQSNKVDLIRWLCGDSFILQHVDSRKLITRDEYKKLKEISNSADRITDLLDTLLRKNDSVCFAFLDLLRDKKVNEFSPDLREWISSVPSSGSSGQITGRSETDRAAGARANPGPQSKAPALNANTNNADLNQDENHQFLVKNRSDLIGRVKNVDGIVDELALTNEKMAIVGAKSTDHAKMRQLLDFCTTSKAAAKDLVTALWKHEHDVMKELV